MSPRAAVVVTGSELTRGGRRDENGPFLAGELARRGLEPARIVVVGDRLAELEVALREGLASDLLVISGGLGPTHDDRTVEVLARVANRKVTVDGDLEERIGAFSRSLAERYRRPYSEFAEGVRKQASLPEGADVLGLAGTAPGFTLEVGGCVVVVLPGPPAELRRLWTKALNASHVTSVLERAQAPSRRVLRLYGVSESAVARVLGEAGGETEAVEATVCAHDGEIEVLLLGESDTLAQALRGALADHVFAEDERSVEELVLDACRAERLTLSVAESCTGGLVAARLTSVPGSSEVFRGGIVAYDDEVKARQLRVPTDLLAAYGAVSAEAAAAMSAGALAALGTEVAVAVTGIAGPGGATATKPVGLVFMNTIGPQGSDAIEVRFTGDRETIRRRAATGALHLVLRLLRRSRHEAV